MTNDAAHLQAHLRYQYDDAEKLRIRIDTHAHFSERTDSFVGWMLPHIAPTPGYTLLDAGCGSGVYHEALLAAGVRVVAVDQSAGMLRDVLSQAAVLGGNVSAVRADVASLPFASASFDRVMANHMMYYVDDQRAALDGMRRLLRRGGRLIMATNAADNQERMFALHRSNASRLGYTPTARDAASFTLDDLPLVRSVFPNARVMLREDAFVFAEADPALRYYASGPIDSITSRPSDGSHREPLLQAMRETIESIIAADGAFRVAKNSGCFIAEA